MNDRFGIGWRPELAAGILSNLDRIDIVEVIADDYFDAPRAKRRALKTLAKQVQVVLHGVTLGLASAVAVDKHRLEKTARLIEEVQPEFWSEHLAFVRGGGIEIGHLAAPPRTEATVEGAARNLATAKRIVGSAPLVENIATLIDPPGSRLSEADWTAKILDDGERSLASRPSQSVRQRRQFRFRSLRLSSIDSPERVAAIHLAGGRWITAKSSNQRRLLDDHLHDVPEPVYELLRYVGEKTSQPLTVILERDGHYPPFHVLMSQLDRARQTLQLARAKQPIDMAAA